MVLAILASWHQRSKQHSKRRAKRASGSRGPRAEGYIRITAVSIDQEDKIALQVDDEAKTDAQHMTDIINEVNAPTVPEQEAPVIEDQVETPIVVAKAKQK